MAIFLVLTMVASVAIAAGSVYGITLYKAADNTLKKGVVPPPEGSDPLSIGDKHSVVGPKCARQICNYLILGSDSRKGLSKAEQQKYGSNKTVPGRRSDTIMLLHIDPSKNKATVLSFPRDLWVKIPGVGMGKITSAYEEGEYRVANVVHQLTDIPINGFLTVDLAGFEGVVRALGGVNICVDRPMVDSLAGLNIPAGCQHLSPEMALSFVRARHVCGDAIPDFSRISRQQQFLRAVLANVLSTGAIFHAKSVIDEVLPNLRVSPGINVADLLYLVDKLQGLTTGAVDFRTVPGNPYATVDVPGVGTEDVVQMEPQAKELFRRLRLGLPLGDLGLTNTQTPPSTAVIGVQIVDDGVQRRRREGAADRRQRRVQRRGRHHDQQVRRDRLGDRVRAERAGQGGGRRPEGLPRERPRGEGQAGAAQGQRRGADRRRELRRQPGRAAAVGRWVAELLIR